MRHRSMRLAAAVSVVASVVATVLAIGIRPAAASGTVDYRPPVDAPVVDRYRPPLFRWDAGNRGLTYGPAEGRRVGAAADGTVVFAGSVAGSLHVTLEHADGLRTSYSFLASIGVGRGQTVRAGDELGRSGPELHFGLRDGTSYLDPEAFFGTVQVRVGLVPHDEARRPVPPGVAHEIALLAELARAENPGRWQRVLATASGAWSVVWSGGGEVLGVLRQVLDDLTADLQTAMHIAIELASLKTDVIANLIDRLTAACTPDSVADTVEPDASGRLAVKVAGLGSSAERGAVDDLDLGALGYDPSRVHRYSYIDDGYGFLETLGDLRDRGRELADDIVALAEAHPGVPVDLYGHSMGGLVVRIALEELEARGALGAVGSVVTVATPHSGSDLATLAKIALEKAGEAVVAGGVPVPPALEQLAEGSDLIEWLRDEGIPDGVRFRSVGFRTDWAVTADKADVDGHPHAVVGGFGLNSHSDLVGSDDVTRELALGLADLPPVCTGLADAVLDAVAPELISRTADLTSGTLLASGVASGRVFQAPDHTRTIFRRPG